jgi:hypothetical protein
MSVTTGALAGSGAPPCRNETTSSRTRSKIASASAGLSGSWLAQHQRLAPSPVGFPWRLLFHAITVMFGGKTRNTSATEEIRVSI